MAKLFTSSTLPPTGVGAYVALAQTLLGALKNLADLLELRGASVKPPLSYSYGISSPGGTGGNGTKLDYSGATRSDKFAWSANVVAGTTTYRMGIAQTPGAKTFSYCTSAVGSCSNEPDAARAAEKGSLSFSASEVVDLDQNYNATIGSTVLASPAAPDCSSTTLTVLPLPAPAPSVATVDARLKGKRLVVANDGTVAVGHAYVDTAGAPVNGCFATAGMTGVLPTGFTATQRSASWSGTVAFGLLLSPQVTAKQDSINCPAPVTDTRITGGTFGSATPYARFLCVFLPVPGTPTISISAAPSGPFGPGKTLTPNKGSWGPAAPNAPTITYTWQRCSVLGCNDIPRKVNLADTAGVRNYTVTADDKNHTIRVVVKSENKDGAATATSGNTPMVP